MFNIIMLKTLMGSEDGFTTSLYKKGGEYIVGKSLFNSFINMKACELKDVSEVIEPVKEVEVIEPVEEVEEDYTPVEETKVIEPVEETSLDIKPVAKKKTYKKKSSKKGK